MLINNKTIKIKEIQKKIKIDDSERLKKILNQLQKEGFIEIKEDIVKLVK
jgi:Mn-dependent DtxR family transcriptional regulator